MKALCRHLPLITNRIEFRLDGVPRAAPLITPRIDFSNALTAFMQENESDVAHEAALRNDEECFEELDQSNHAFSPEPGSRLNGIPMIFARIPKPAGEPGRPHSGGYNLDDELGAWDAELLCAINNHVKSETKSVLDPTKSYSKQDPARLSEVCSSAARLFPIVEKYENHWPVRDMLKLHLKYTSEAHRKANQEIIRRGKKARSGIASEDCD